MGEGERKEGEGKERGRREGGKAEGKGREVPYFRLTLLATLIARPKHRQTYDTLKSAFEHRSVTEYDRISARARPPPLFTGD